VFYVLVTSINMASASVSIDVNIDDCNGEFDLDKVAVYNILNVGRFIVNSFENTFNFCVNIGLLNDKRKCSRCRRVLKLSVDRREHSTTPVVLRCNNKSCLKDTYSIRGGTFFERSNLSLQQTLVLINLFCAEVTAYDQVRHEAQLSSERLSYHSIADWQSYCREVCLEIISRETPTLIGGEGMTVEIHESKLIKRKYNKGQWVQWVLGGICRETNDVFLAVFPDNKHDAPTLLEIIERHVDKNSTVIMDCWRTYEQHLTVNHEYNFVGKMYLILFLSGGCEKA